MRHNESLKEAIIMTKCCVRTHGVMMERSNGIEYLRDKIPYLYLKVTC